MVDRTKSWTFRGIYERTKARLTGGGYAQLAEARQPLLQQPSSTEPGGKPATKRSSEK